MSAIAAAGRLFAVVFGRVGCRVLKVGGTARLFLFHTGGIWRLLAATLYHAAVDPFRGPRQLRQQLFLMMGNVGVQSFPIVALISFLMGAILLLQSGEPLERYGQLSEVPGPVAWSLTREISPLLTSIIMTARVGASFTAVLASMKINEELLALETMAIQPVSYLVAPRFVSMLVMLPCLTIFSYLIGMFGAALVANGVYDLSYSLYVRKTVYYLDMTDVVSGLVKSGIFGSLITIISCYFGLITEGGSVGLGRNIMVAVVTSLVAVIVADALATAVINNYVL
jgi:phospholipid/cholesterol/gamma-HCH transport system permease protein